MQISLILGCLLFFTIGTVSQAEVLPAERDKTNNSDSYIQNRGLSDYRQILGSDFSKFLGSLTKNDLWLDSGAGNAIAMIDYLSIGGPARSLAIDAREPQNSVTLAALKKFPQQFTYQSGRYVQDYGPNELPSCKLITDVFGAVTYSSEVDVVFNRLLNALVEGGKLYFEAGMYTYSDRPNEDSDNLLIYKSDQGSLHPVPVRAWFNAISGAVYVEDVFYTSFVKTQKTVVIPRLKLISISYDTGLPVRKYLWE
jgi:hypothetical protein